MNDEENKAPDENNEKQLIIDEHSVEESLENADEVGICSQNVTND